MGKVYGGVCACVVVSVFVCVCVCVCVCVSLCVSVLILTPTPFVPGDVETAVIIGVGVAVATVILILILAAFVAVLVCLKHKTTSESERRWGGGCAGCTSPSRLLCFIYTSTGWPLPQLAASECPFTAYERVFERNWHVISETLWVVCVAKHGFTWSCLPLAIW